MTTYIEVDPAVELPTIEDTYFILINGVKGMAEFHVYENLQPHLHMKPGMWTRDDRNGYEYEVKPGSWLKPIDEQEEAQKRYDEAIRFIDDSNKNGASERVGEHVLNIGIKIAAGLKDKP